VNASSRVVSILGMLLALSGLFLLAPKAQAQSQASNSSDSAVAPPSQFPVPYDVSKEIKIQGTIQQIDTSNDRTPVGTHVLLQTSSGVVDAHLGPLNKASLNALQLSVGESLTLTGMNESTSSGTVMLVRILTTPSRVVILRSEHGFPVRSLVRRGASTSPLFKGGL